MWRFSNYITNKVYDILDLILIGDNRIVVTILSIINLYLVVSPVMLVLLIFTQTTKTIAYVITMSGSFSTFVILIISLCYYYVKTHSKKD